jgi:hypothetical protein
MIRNDFLMRLIELLGVFVARVMRRIEDGDWEGAGKEIEAEAKATIGLPMAVLENTPLDDLISLFSSRAGTDFPRLLTAAILLSVQGDLLFREGNEIAARLRWAKAMTLFLEATGSPDPDIEGRSSAGLAELENKLDRDDLSEEWHLRLAAHHERLGHFALAENHWFDGTEESADRDAIRLGFYGRIASLPDEVLETGGVTRREIEESIAALGGMSG